MIERAPISGVAAVNGARLAYDLAGDGPVVVLLHAGITDRRMWDDQFLVLAERFRVLRFDHRGYGESDNPPGAFSSHDDVRAMLGELSIDRAALIGISMGGRVALNTALAHPALVTALVVSATLAGTPERSDALRQSWADTEAAAEAGDLDGAVEIELRTWVDGPNRAPKQVAPAVRERVRIMDRALIARAIAEGEPGEEIELTPPAHERLHEIRAPALLIGADEDLPDVGASMSRLAAGIPHAESLTFEGAAHMLTMEQPDRFNQAAIAFLERVLG